MLARSRSLYAKFSGMELKLAEDFAKGHTVGIMQPYFFPYWGHFCLITSTDRWIVFDTPQYTPKTWVNRNRVLHPNEGWMYLSVPLSNGSIHKRISEIKVKDRFAAHKSMRGKIGHYRKRAPYFKNVIEIIDETFEKAVDDSLVALNIASLDIVCRYLDIPFNWRRASELSIEIPSSLKAGEWAPHISSQIGATGYINPIGGRELFDPNLFSKLDVNLSFLDVGQLSYETHGYTFMPNLSILDALMWVDPESLRHTIRNEFSLTTFDLDLSR